MNGKQTGYRGFENLALTCPQWRKRCYACDGKGRHYWFFKCKACNGTGVNPLLAEVERLNGIMETIIGRFDY
jgi:DnaJ-class molecular chaperone